jgi:hypothetical protein
MREQRDWREIPAPRDHKNGGYKRIISGFRKWLYTRLGVWTSSQNLNADYVGGEEHVKGSIWRNGRAWLHYGREGHKNIELSWSLWGKHKFAGFQVGVGGDEDDLSFSLMLWVFSVWLSFDNLFPCKWKWNDFRAIKKGVTPGFIPGNTRTTGVRFFDGRMWVQCWYDDSGWDNKVPGHWGGFHFTFSPVDFLLGRHNYSKETLATYENVDIPMPEGSYPATVKLERATWKRTRWPFKRTIIRANIDMGDNPIPFPGKGENSWDCGDDATYALTTPASTLHEAVGAMMESVTRNRIKNGGVDWRPESKIAV